MKSLPNSTLTKSSAARVLLAAAYIAAGISLPAYAADGVRLATLASTAGFAYDWLPSEGGVQLARPGVVVVLRAGRPLYEVNAATVVADRAPRFDGSDLVISQPLAEQLRRIARAYPIPQLAQTTSDVRPAAATGTLTIIARQIPGREVLSLSGTGPANVLITIVLRAELSRDLPLALVNQTSVATGTDGRFSVELGFGRDTHRRTAIAATATTVSGVASAVARVIVDVPNPNLDSPLDKMPK